MYGLGGALRAPLGPVVAPLVPRCALLPAPTPRMRSRCARFSLANGHSKGPERRWSEGACTESRRRSEGSHRLSGGSPREGVRSEVRAQQRLAAGGAAPPTRSKFVAYLYAGLQAPPT